MFSITLRSIFNYPGEYVQLPWGVCSTTLGSMFNYPGEYFQLPWGVFSTTLGSMFNYPGEYVQLTSYIEVIQKVAIRTRLSEKIRKTSSENAGEVFARRFFDFFWDASRETPTFETMFGRPRSETGLKSKRFVRCCPTKIKKTSRESAVPSQK